MSVCCECCVLSGRGLCDGLITRPEESYRLWCVVVCDLETSRIKEALARVGPQRHRKNKSTVILPTRQPLVSSRYVGTGHEILKRVIKIGEQRRSRSRTSIFTNIETTVVQPRIHSPCFTPHLFCAFLNLTPLPNLQYFLNYAVSFFGLMSSGRLHSSILNPIYSIISYWNIFFVSSCYKPIFSQN